jgi:hypothetical protein
MEVKVTLRDLLIKDEETHEWYTVRTLRTVKEIAEFIEESEKEVIVSKLEEAVAQAY